MRVGSEVIDVCSKMHSSRVVDELVVEKQVVDES